MWPHLVSSVYLFKSGCLLVFARVKPSMPLLPRIGANEPQFAAMVGDPVVSLE